MKSFKVPEFYYSLLQKLHYMTLHSVTLPECLFYYRNSIPLHYITRALLCYITRTLLSYWNFVKLPKFHNILPFHCKILSHYGTRILLHSQNFLHCWNLITLHNRNSIVLGNSIILQASIALHCQNSNKLLEFCKIT